MVWTSKRSPNFPDAPTLNELGYDMVYDSPFGIAGPKGMDPKIVAKLHDAFVARFVARSAELQNSALHRSPSWNRLI